MTIGDNIRLVRKRMGWTQEKLGGLLGVSGSMIAQYETGKRKPKVETVVKIAHATGTPWLDFYPDSERSQVFSEYKHLFQGSDIPDGMATAGASLGKLRQPQERVLVFMGKLNEAGQEKAIERVAELAEIPRYQKEPETPPQAPQHKKGGTAPEE